LWARLPGAEALGYLLRLASRDLSVGDTNFKDVLWVIVMMTKASHPSPKDGLEWGTWRVFGSSTYSTNWNA
jgi:hypothetical protein